MGIAPGLPDTAPLPDNLKCTGGQTGAGNNVWGRLFSKVWASARKLADYGWELSGSWTHDVSD